MQLLAERGKDSITQEPGGFLLMQNSRFGIPFAMSSGARLHEAALAEHPENSPCLPRDDRNTVCEVGVLTGVAQKSLPRQCPATRKWVYGLVGDLQLANPSQLWEDSEGDDHQEARPDVVTR